MLLSFRPRKSVIKYLKPIKNRSREINDILERYIVDVSTKNHKTRVSWWLDKEVEYIDIEQVLEDNKLEREAPLFQEVVKDKTYYNNLNKYTTIKSMWWCFSANWEWLDTQEAISYAGLQSFTP